LREMEIERYGMPALIVTGFKTPSGCETLQINTIPAAVSAALVQSVAVVSCGTRARTNKDEVHQAWEGDNQTVFGVNDIAAVQLEERPWLAPR
jgi:hypothetical protein